MQIIREYDEVPYSRLTTLTDDFVIGPLNSETAELAIDQLHLNSNFDAREQLLSFMQEQYEICHCVVLSAVSTASKNFFVKHGIDVGKQEIIITSKGAILYSRNYFVSPYPAVQQ